MHASEPNFRFGIQVKLLITMIGLIICLLTTLTYVQISVQKRILEKEQEQRILLKKEILNQRGITLTENLADQVENDLASLNLSNLREVIHKAVANDSELAYAIVMDSKRIAYVHTLHPEYERTLLNDHESIWASLASVSTIHRYIREGNTFIEFIVPLAISTESWGRLRLGFTLETVNQEIMRSQREITRQNKLMVRRSIFTSLIFIGLGSLVVLYISKKLSNPLHRLTESVHHLENGDFDAASKVRIDSGDEVGVLASAFTRMSKKLKRSYEKLEDYSHTLEEKVKERTNKLSQTLRELKETQSQLVQSEKMASLGTLVAGVAHEINNPVNFIHNGASNINSFVKELREFTFHLMGGDASQRIRNAFNERFNPIFDNLNSVMNGSDRINSIVRDLRSFSRFQEAEKKQVPVVDCLESTLSLIEMNYKGKIQFECDFRENPILECWPAQLNQVFMNIMVNGCQAILSNKNHQSQESPGRFRILTKVEKGSLIIRFQDNGCGIPTDVQNKIFEPFFTTKSVGQGIGLGLSISFSIVEKHKGKILVESEQGKGTTFDIILPLSQAESALVSYKGSLG